MGSQGSPHRHLDLTLRAPGEQQVRHVGARDEEHQARDGKQERQGGAGLLVKRALSPIPLLQFHPLGAKRLQRLLAHPLLEGCLHLVDDAGVHRVDAGVHLGHGGVRGPSPEQVDPVRPAVVVPHPGGVQNLPHGDGQVHVGAVPQRRPVESRRCHSHHGERLAVDHQRPVQDTRIRAQLVLPVVVVQDRHEVLADILVVATSPAGC